MANRRMFSLDIVGTDKFQGLPIEPRLLYYELGMRADDDGFVQPLSVMRTTGLPQSALQILVGMSYVYLYKDGVMVILDWKKNNLIKGDRYRPTEYQQHYALLPQIYSELRKKQSLDIGSESLLEPKWNQSGTQVEPQDRIGEDSVGKVSKETNTNVLVPAGEPTGYGKWNDEFQEKLGFRITKKPKENENALKSLIKDSSPEMIHRVLEYLGWLKATKKAKERPYWFQFTTSFIKIREQWDNIQHAMTDDSFHQLKQQEQLSDFFNR